jgi:hypothetical protein
VVWADEKQKDRIPHYEDIISAYVEKNSIRKGDCNDEQGYGQGTGETGQRQNGRRDR